jgi:hypothetical protein
MYEWNIFLLWIYSYDPSLLNLRLPPWTTSRVLLRITERGAEPRKHIKVIYHHQERIYVRMVGPGGSPQAPPVPILQSPIVLVLSTHRPATSLTNSKIIEHQGTAQYCHVGEEIGKFGISALYCILQCTCIPIPNPTFPHSSEGESLFDKSEIDWASLLHSGQGRKDKRGRNLAWTNSGIHNTYIGIGTYNN